MRVLWGRTTSINVQKVAWVMAETGVAHEQIDLGGKHKGLDTADYIAMNPNKRVPTLVEGDFVLWESNAICRYLVESNGGVLAASSAQERAHADMWMEWFQGAIYAPFIAMFYQTVRLPAAERDADVLKGAVAKLDDAFAIAEDQLEGRDYLLGDSLSLADIPFGACLYRYFTVDIPRPHLPNISAYYNRLAARAPYQSAVMVDYSSLRPAT